MVSPVRTRTVSFQMRLGSTLSSRLMTRKRPAPWMWKGWCIGWSFEDSAAGLRFDPRVEAAAYFCAAEAARAFDHPIALNLSVHGDQLHLSVSGTERGGLSLSHMRDRIEATGGSVSTTGRDGRTFVEVRAPSARALVVP